MNAGSPRQVTAQTRDLDGRTLHIVDGLFDAAMIRLLHESFVRMPFSFTEIDSEESRHILHWKFDFDPQAVQRNPILLAWRDRILHKTGELVGAAELPLTRLYCNSTLFGDHQHSHIDSTEGTTALYFANAQWDENWQGETIFYDRAGEARYAVAPRPGRLAVFPAECLHRGGVPSKACVEPRLTVAFKLGAAR